MRVTMILLVCMSMVLTGCMSYRISTPSPANPALLKKKQAEILQSYGFVLTPDGWMLAMSERLLFDTNSFEIQENRKAMLRDLTQKLKQYRLHHVKVVGHTDNVGTEEYNHQLSLKRAYAVANVLIGAGYDSTHLEIVGRGMSQPIYPNDSAEHRAENRRVALVIVQD